MTGLQCDVRDEAAVVSAVQTINSAMGPISVLINAAGINQDKLLIKSKTEDIRNMLDVNLVGSMTTCKVVLRSMIQQRSGCIINIGDQEMNTHITGHKLACCRSFFSGNISYNRRAQFFGLVFHREQNVS